MVMHVNLYLLMRLGRQLGGMEVDFKEGGATRKAMLSYKRNALRSDEQNVNEAFDLLTISAYLNIVYTFHGRI